MANQTGNATTEKRSDLYTSFNFRVEIDEVEVGGFTDVSGLTVETTVDRKKFGGENHREYTFVTGTKFTDLTLKRGIADIDLLWKWYEEVTNGKIKRKNVSVYLRDHAGTDIKQWDFRGAYPIKWEGPTFDAKSNTVAAESIVLTHNGFVKQK